MSDTYYCALTGEPFEADWSVRCECTTCMPLDGPNPEERLIVAVRAYDAALTAWGTAAAQHDRTAIQAAKDAMDTAYRIMVDLARKVGE